MAQSKSGSRTATRANRERQMRDRRRTRTRRNRPVRTTINIPWTTVNFIGIGLGLAVIVVGYLLMQSAIADDPVGDKSLWNNSASTSIAPMVLAIGYCVILPIAIFWRKKDGGTADGSGSEAESN